MSMMAYIYCKLQSGLLVSVEERTRVNRHGRFYVMVFSVYWILLGAFYFGAWHYDPVQGRIGIILEHLFPAVIAGHGTLLFFAWCYVNQIPRRILRSIGCGPDESGISRSTSEDPTAPWVQEELKVDQNIVEQLRMEFVYLTAGGIRQSAARFGDIMWNRYHTEPRGSTHWPSGLQVDQTEVSLGGGSLPGQVAERVVDNLGLDRESLESVLVEQHSKTASYCQQQCDFYDYAPALFHQVRQSVGIQPMDYCQSFRDYEDGVAGMKERFSEGKSGSFMYFTFDRRYVVKTISTTEVDCMMEILPEYAAHVASSDGTLLHYYGCHSIRLPERSSRVYFIVMKNVLADPMVPRVRCTVQKTYDLKGALFLRRAEQSDSTKLDQDWLEDVDEFTVRNMCDDSARQVIQAWIARDAAFLSQMGVIDYSLLFGIAEFEDGAVVPSSSRLQDPQFTSPVVTARDLADVTNWTPDRADQRDHHVIYGKKYVLYFGIIDVLQKYSCWWWIQQMCLQAWLWLVCKDPETITAVPPAFYASRFADFMRESVLQVNTDHLSHSPALFTPLGRMSRLDSGGVDAAPLLASSNSRIHDPEP